MQRLRELAPRLGLEAAQACTPDEHPLLQRSERGDAGGERLQQAPQTLGGGLAGGAAPRWARRPRARLAVAGRSRGAAGAGGGPSFRPARPERRSTGSACAARPRAAASAWGWACSRADWWPPAERQGGTRGKRPGADTCGTETCGTDTCGTDTCGTDTCGTDTCGTVTCGTGPAGRTPAGRSPAARVTCGSGKGSACTVWAAASAIAPAISNPCQALCRPTPSPCGARALLLRSRYQIVACRETSSLGFRLALGLERARGLEHVGGRAQRRGVEEVREPGTPRARSSGRRAPRAGSGRAAATPRRSRAGAAPPARALGLARCACRRAHRRCRPAARADRATAG